MCELFAMSSRIPVNVTFSLTEFARHGGATGPHKDGWGIAYYEQGDARIIKDSNAAADSSYVQFIESLGLASNIVISHVRKATQGARLLKNTQPFTRELGGRMHVFAHNGMLTGVEHDSALRLGNYRPVGDTDSEYAFCALLQMMQALWLDEEPSIAARLQVVEEFAHLIRDLGPANFIYSDSEVTFAHGHRRTQSDGSISPPGLFYLCRSCANEAGSFTTPGLSIHSEDEQQEVVLTASVPLTDETWQPLAEGEILVMQGGHRL